MMSELVLKGDIGTLTTHTSFKFDQNTLRRISSEANFADGECQFSMWPATARHGGSHWYIKSGANTRNLTVVNGEPVGETPKVVRVGDVIAIKSRTSEKTAVEMQVQRAIGGIAADIVFLIDASEGMGVAAAAIKESCKGFHRLLSVSMQFDVRVRVLGYRSISADPGNWYVDHPFVSDGPSLERQLDDVEFIGGGETESLMEALYRITEWGRTDQGTQEIDPEKWRYRNDAYRCVVVFTNAAYSEKSALPEDPDFTWEDVANAVMRERLRLSLFAPEMECYENLACVDKCEFEAVPCDSSVKSDVAMKLRDLVSDPAFFQREAMRLADDVVDDCSDCVFPEDCL